MKEPQDTPATPNEPDERPRLDASEAPAAEVPALVRTAAHAAALEPWALVLTALYIPHRLVETPAGAGLVVGRADEARARAALDAYDRESREDRPEPPPPDRGRSWAGAVIAAGLLAFFAVTGERSGADARGWFRDGSAIAERIVGGEVHRAVTALTLHADLMHVVGNALATLVFLGAASRWVGGGLATLLALGAGAAGNLVVALSYGARHNSVGASTGTFAALGLLGGLQVVRWLSGRPGWMHRRRALTAVGACLGLFAMLGVGERADVMAHAAGLAFGLLAGVLAALGVRRRPVGRWGQVLCGACAGALVLGAWWLARR